jgi:hypothetical protein
MELELTFRHGVMKGEGRDLIGPFLIRGRYQTESGECWWTKRYIGKHDVHYRGFNEGKGIWGVWEIPPSSKGGFCIWPEAWGDPTGSHLKEAVDAPVGSDDPAESESETEAEVGAGVLVSPH